MESKMKVRDLISFFKETYPIFFSHHPDCGIFDEDTMKIGRIRLCIGCFVSYPTAIFLVASFFILEIFEGMDTHLSWPHFLVFAIVSGLFQFISVLGRTDTKARKVIVKFLLGLSMASSTLFMFTLPYSLWLRILLFGLGVYIAGVLSGYRALTLKKVCVGCPYKGDWFICPGFRKVNVSAIRHGIIDPPYKDFPRVIRRPRKRDIPMKEPRELRIEDFDHSEYNSLEGRIEKIKYIFDSF